MELFHLSYVTKRDGWKWECFTNVGIFTSMDLAKSWVKEHTAENLKWRKGGPHKELAEHERVCGRIDGGFGRSFETYVFTIFNIERIVVDQPHPP